MKKFSFLMVLLLGIFSLTMVSCKDNDDEPVAPNELSQTAKNFIAKFYPDAGILSVVKDRDNGRDEYDVLLSNGHEIVFDASGEWLDVDAPMGETIPAGIAPVKIEDYVNANYSGYGINEISKENYGYNVELTNGIDLEFNSAGDFLRIER